MNRILVVEDEEPIADSVAYALEAEGFEVEIAYDGSEALRAFKNNTPHLVVLDLMLPVLGGMDFCRIVRKESGVPIIILTAKTEEIEKVVGLELGADDYITKPFSLRELVARVRAVLRRVEMSMRELQEDATMTVGPIEMDIVKRRVLVRGEAVHLPLKQFELLKVFMQNAGKTLSREELVRYVWDSDSVPESGSLDVHIRWLREKIEDIPGHPRYLKTIRGVGYALVDESD